MKVNCILRTFYRDKKNKKQDFYEITDFGSSFIEESAKNPDLEMLYKLQIVSLSEKDEPIEVLQEKEIVPDDKTHFYIHFHSIGYVYFNGYIYCLTLIHDI